MFDSPINYFKTQNKKTISRKNSNEEITRTLITRDPFASLSRNNSNKLEPLSPEIKLPKICLALPPRPSLNFKKQNLLCQADNIKKEDFCKETPRTCMNTPTSLRASSKKIKRIKISGSLSGLPERETSKIMKKRNSVIVLDSENDVTFGLVGNIIINDRIN